MPIRRWVCLILCHLGLFVLACSQAVIVGTVFGCGGGGSASAGSFLSTASIPDSINEDRSEGLLGIDTDHNGIRDDIDALIAQKYSTTPEIRRGAEQDARAMQRLLEATTKEEAIAADKQGERAESCLLWALSDMDEYINASRLIEALTANTHERLKKYLLHSNKLLSGTTSRSIPPTEQACDE